MHYTYVLRSGQDEGFYTGCTSDLRQRYREHANGRVRSSHRLPLELVYYEACLSRDDALRRERFLKSGKGKRYLRTRLAGHLGSLSLNKLERH
ncbi:MAG: GIY-YIG nuclease family protein [Terriglobales bacterium]